MKFSNKDKYLATGSADVSCKVWNVEKGFEIANTIEGHVYSITSLAFLDKDN